MSPPGQHKITHLKLWDEPFFTLWDLTILLLPKTSSSLIRYVDSLTNIWRSYSVGRDRISVLGCPLDATSILGLIFPPLVLPLLVAGPYLSSYQIPMPYSFHVRVLLFFSPLLFGRVVVSTVDVQW